MDDLKLIKKHYGEKMMHLCRELFPTLLETEGLLFHLLSSTFAYSRQLYEDLKENNYIDEFKNIIFDKAVIKKQKDKKSNKTPQELLDEAGYILYECHSEKDIQSFRHFYKRAKGIELPIYVEGERPAHCSGEELCTFNGQRLEMCHVFFAVKKNVDEIRRDDFIGKEARQDEYGTSVISIQFTKGSSNTVSIKNRYNHTVANPDATFSNNLDNIIAGLTDAFEVTYGFNINSSERKTDLPGYVLANDGKLYKYNFERNNKYYCPNNIIIDNFEVKEFDKSRYIIFESFILDMQEKTIKCYDQLLEDSFIEGINPINSIEILNQPNEEKNIIINKDIVITLNKTNQIIKYKNHHLTHIGSRFLINNRCLEELDVPNVTIIEDYALRINKSLKKLDLPLCTEIGDYVLENNYDMLEVNLPNVKNIGSSFLRYARKLQEIDLPNVETIKNDFMRNNGTLKRITAPKLKKVGNEFLSQNRYLEEISFEELESIGEGFISFNDFIRKVNLPKVKTIGDFFLQDATILEELVLPCVETIGRNFLRNNKKLRNFVAPNLKKIEELFLYENEELITLDLPEVTAIGNDCLKHNKKLLILNLPKLKEYWSNRVDISKIRQENMKKLMEEKGILWI